ncbi:MAG: 3-phosphoglycerate dehydrogenase, partial [Lachnospiraceae bacterium]|nr:3-phosphoglycerate dehydrogenase [Lachnospiraceae bacterium]
NICAYLGMTVYGYDPYISVGSAWRLKREIRHIESLDELFEKCDYITVHVPAIPSSRDMLNSLTFAKMKDGVKVLNFSRDFVVNEDDIAAALESGKVSRYVTDFATPKSVRMKNTVVIPHLGASTEEAEDNCALMAVRQLQDYLDNGNIKNSVNYPDIDAGKCRTESRIACLHRNVPNMLGQLTAIMGSAHINIANMVNASRDKYAYTLMDIETRISDDALDSIRAIPGMLRVRIVK